ncbi:arylamine N-acetyltransferase [Kitasatospora sp. NPDC101801]|uniref:arylamine N-acetyltransferase family protein n=1 Tax=Kitasatospora sp. NPDC101801 TaxID=3364103 RepID=UPI0037F27D22
MSTTSITGYLQRLGLGQELEPTLDNLRRLHRAHVERIPYETLDFQLGRPVGLDPAESVDRIARRGRGGYCFQLNGAFRLLLAELGYRVTMHRVGVQGTGDQEPVGVNGNHLALTVAGLPTPEVPAGHWLVDVGLGFAFHEPLPLQAGTTVQGPFGYRLASSSAEPGAWRLEHHPVRGFVGADISTRAAGIEEFAAEHVRLSTAPESEFVRLARVQRRDALGTDLLLGRVLTRITAEGERRRELADADEWFGALREVFGLPLDELDAAERRRLWETVDAAHLAWSAASGSV